METAFGASDFRDKEYGVDYVNLGYLAGGETAMARVARDIVGSFPGLQRERGELPVMEEHYFMSRHRNDNQHFFRNAWGT